MQQIGSSSWTKASLAGLGLCAACGGDPVEAVSETDGTEASDGSTTTDPEQSTSEPTSATTNEGMTSTSDTTAGTDPDDGTGSSTDDGTDTGGPGVCGDGEVDEGEACDDGNGNDHDDCPDGPLGTCQPASCSDGVVHDEGSGQEAFVDCGPGCPLACPSSVLLSELATGPGGAFIELYNPGGDEVDLSHVYLANFPSYYDHAVMPGMDEFRARFPPGATLGPQQRLVVAVAGGTPHTAAHGVAPDYDLDPGDAAAPALDGEYGMPQLSGAAGMVVLYGWDGNADLVQDIDYVVYGDTAAGMDKTGVDVGGSSFQDETALAAQIAAPAPSPAGSTDRCVLDEPGEALAGGNGMSGHDETSEDLAAAFGSGPFPTPGADNACGQCLATLPSAATFVASAEDYGGALTSWGPQLGDFDGDGDLDAFACRTNGDPHLLLMGDGDGTFTDAGFATGGNCRSTGMGDLDGDGDLDLYVNVRNGPDQAWLNDGAGGFTSTGQAIGGNENSYGMAMGDIDGDGDPDAVIGLAGGGPNQVFLNDGTGMFSDTGQGLGSQNTLGMALGDLDGDGDLDLFSLGWNSADLVFLNDGAGVFTDSGQLLDTRGGRAVGLGDLDGDGDLDAFVGNTGASTDSVWFNDGAGVFVDSGQTLGGAGGNSSFGVGLGDLDGDGDLDAYVGQSDGPDRVWLNDGTGVFSDSGQQLDPSTARHVTLGDVDGDCDLDAFVVNSNVDTVWFNG